MRLLIVVVAVLIGIWIHHDVDAAFAIQDERSMPVLGPADEEKLSHIQSDEDAKALFMSRLRDSLGLQKIVPDTVTARPKAKGPQPDSLPPDWTENGVKLTAELAARQLAARLIQAADSREPTAIRTLLEQTPMQQSWLCTHSLRSELCRAVRLAAVVAAFPPLFDNRVSAETVDRYHEYLDHTFPHLAETEDSWIQLADREGAEGIRKRLMKFWEDPSTGQHDPTESEKQTWAAAYFFSRLKPVLTAYIVASATKAQSQAEQSVRSYWNGLKTSLELTREVKGLTRLCGTWQWTIHNHQHHLDQKIAMVFAHPGNESFTGPRPSKTVVLGDVVYLRWEYPGGIQEDSLLFTGDGQRLEGSFVNSSGAWGSITGKRTAPCTRQ